MERKEERKERNEGRREGGGAKKVGILCIGAVLAPI